MVFREIITLGDNLSIQLGMAELGRKLFQTKFVHKNKNISINKLGLSCAQLSSNTLF